MSSVTSTEDYRPDIDGLRAVAVSSVVAFHAFPHILKGGFVGVDIFFVISGFLISRIIFQGIARGDFSYLGFYGKRIRRIFPALIAVFALTSAIAWFVLLPNEFMRFGKHLAGGAAFVSNLILWNESGYFDADATSKPFLHLWSLGIEEQFYIVWPLVLGLFVARSRRFLLVVLVVAILSFLVNLALVQSHPVAAFYSPFARFWELMAGAILAHLSLQASISSERFRHLQSAAGATLIAVAVVLLNKESVFPGFWALLPVLGSYLIIAAGPRALINRYVLGLRPMVGIGLVSYPFYLWHWPLLVLGGIVFGILTPVQRIAIVVAAFLLSVATYWWCERPLRRMSTQRVALPLAGVMAALALLGLTAMLGLSVARLRSAHIDQILAASSDWEFPPATAERHPFGALRYFEERGIPGENTLFIGDSNLEQYGPRIDRVIKDHPGRARGALLVGNQAPCKLLDRFLVGSSQCPKSIDDEIDALVSAPSTRAIAFAASWLGYAGELESPANQQQFVAFLRKVTSRTPVFLILNIPSGAELSPTSMFVGSRLHTISPKPLASLHFDLAPFEARYFAVNAALRADAAQGGATVIDPIPVLCGKTQCPIFDSAGDPLYLDAAHLTRRYSRSSATYIDVTLGVGPAK